MHREILTFIIILVFVVGCTTNYVGESNNIPHGQNGEVNSAEESDTNMPTENDKISEQLYTISGVDEYQEISSEQPIKLVLSGTRNEVSVLDGTQVNSIVVSGIDNKINLPKESNPEITDSGLRTQINYR